jgi:hypothetical protein
MTDPGMMVVLLICAAIVGFGLGVTFGISTTERKHQRRQARYDETAFRSAVQSALDHIRLLLETRK